MIFAYWQHGCNIVLAVSEWRFLPAHPENRLRSFSRFPPGGTGRDYELEGGGGWGGGGDLADSSRITPWVAQVWDRAGHHSGDKAIAPFFLAAWTRRSRRRARSFAGCSRRSRASREPGGLPAVRAVIVTPSVGAADRQGKLGALMCETEFPRPTKVPPPMLVQIVQSCNRQRGRELDCSRSVAC